MNLETFSSKFQDYPLVIIANFGDESIALIQWVHDTFVNHKNIHIIYVNTGWAAPEWQLRVQTAKQWSESLGFQVHFLNPPASFENLMIQQGKFPSRKFQWCANFLKALPILDFLDELDPELNFIILLARRRAASRINFNLPEFIFEEPKWGDRKLWHPLYLHTQEDRDALITKTPFLNPLNHRSLECDPCVNSDLKDLIRIKNNKNLFVLTRLENLEKKLESQLLSPELYPGLYLEKNNIQPAELFDMGCGNTFGCGL